MTDGLQPYLERTKDDAISVVRRRFSDVATGIALRCLSNPLRSLERSAGDVAYEASRPVGFQAAILRRLFLGCESFVGTVGGMLAMDEGASPVLLVRLMRASITSRGGSRIFYANTANATSMKMNRLLGIRGAGPLTCERTRFSIVWRPRFVRRFLSDPVAVRLDQLDDRVFSAFWSEYLQSNRGLVSSRKPEELTWLFGDRIRSGEVVLLGRFQGDRLIGYIALKSSRGGKSWLIIDWIALRNDDEVLASLLLSAKRFASKNTDALIMETIGFPEYAESLLRHQFPFKRKTGNNVFIWKSLDGSLKIPDESWFFGPYDGDRCM